MQELAAVVTEFLEKSMPKIAHLSEELTDRVAGLRLELDSWSKHREIRRVMALMCGHFVALLGKQRMIGMKAFEHYTKDTNGFVHDIIAMASLGKMSHIKDMKYAPATDHLDEDVVLEICGGASGSEEISKHMELVNFVAAFSSGACFEQIFKYHLVSPVKEADAIFAETALAILRGLSMTDLEASFQGLSATDALAKMIPSTTIENLATAATRDHDIETLDPAMVRNDLAVSSFSSALLRWVELSGLATLPTKLSLDESDWPSSDMEKAVKAYCHVCQTASLASVLVVQYADNAQGLVINAEVDGQQASVVTMGVSRFVTEFKLHLESWPVIRDMFYNAPSHTRAAFPIQSLDRIMNFFTSFASHCKNCIYDQLSAGLGDQIKLLNKLVPAWSHLITAKKYNSALAVKQLLNPSMQAKLDDGMHSTFHMTSSISRLYSEWGDDAMLEDHPVIAEADVAVDNARNAMTIIACVGLLEVKLASDSDRAAKAAKLMKAKCVPDALRAKLKELVSG